MEFGKRVSIQESLQEHRKCKFFKKKVKGRHHDVSTVEFLFANGSLYIINN
mgnify:CR=1